MRALRIFALLVGIMASMGAGKPVDAAEADRQIETDKESLAKLQAYVGGWRGVGQVQRGSNKGAWSEQSDWAWHFDQGRASITFAAPKGKHFTGGEIRATDKPGVFELLATRPGDDKAQDSFMGKLDEDGRLVFTADNAGEDAVARVTLRQVAGGDRLIVLLEKRLAAGDRYAQLAEIGYTRIGAQFAQGASKPECIVTGGAGTIAVMHDGKTYFVCCSGCKELFDADPAGVLAEYKAKKEKEKK